jgi:transposase
MTTVSVLSGRERRRRWASEEKQRIVEESLAAGACIAAVARRHDVHPNLLHLWRRQARTGVQRGAASQKAAPDGVGSFAAVRIAAERPLGSTVSTAAPGMIEIEFASGTRLRITGAVDPATASAAVAAVAEAGR